MREENNKKYYKSTEKGNEIIKDTIFPWNHKEDINETEDILKKMENYTQYIIDNSGKLTDKDLDIIKNIYKQLDIFK